MANGKNAKKAKRASTRRTKKGKFSNRGKTGFQGKLREKNLAELQYQKLGSLAEDERRMLEASKALKSEGKTGKAGKFYNKQYREKQKQRQIRQPSSKSPEEKLGSIGTNAQMESMLFKKQQIPLKNFMQSQSQTGAVSMANVGNFVDKFASKIKGDTNTINKLKVTGEGQDKKLNVYSDYSKASFKLNPQQLTLESSGWKKNIPESWKKVGDNKYVAPKKNFKKYEEEDDDDETVKYGKYTPTEVKFSKTNQPLKLVERGVYTPYKYEEEDVDGDDEDEYEETKKSVFKKKVQDYFGTGLSKRKQKWKDYLKYQYEEEEDDGEDEEYEEEIEKRGIFKNLNIKYNPSGTKKEAKTWGSYIKREEEEQDGWRDEEEERKGDTYLSSHRKFDKRGRPIMEKQWGTYRTEEEEYEGPGRWTEREEEEERKRDTYLKSQKDYGRPGQVRRSQQWSPYRSYEDRERESGGGEEEEIKWGIMQDYDKYFDPKGDKAAEKIWDTYRSREEETTTRGYGPKGEYLGKQSVETEEEKRPYLQRKTRYGPQGQVKYSEKYSPYLIGKKIKKERRPQEIKGGVLPGVDKDDVKNLTSEQLAKQTKGEDIVLYTPRTMKTVKSAPIETTEIEKKGVGLRQLQFFDKDTGNLVTKKYW